MISREERERRKGLRHSREDAERTARTALLPLTAPVLRDLIDSVHGRVVTEGCDHTTRFAEQWAAGRRVPWSPLAEGLAEFGGFCDCEVVMNCDPGDVFG